MKRLIALLFLAGCVSASSFDSGELACTHTTSSPNMLGTVQVIHCWDRSGALVTNAVLNGTSVVEPIEKAVEAGALIGGAYGILKNAPTVNTNNAIHLGP